MVIIKEVIETLEGTPALMYTALWQTREMGFLKNILDDLKIKNLKILFYFKDYKPGGLLTLNGELGDFTVESIDSLEGVEYDGAVIGSLRSIAKAMEGNILLRGFWALFSRKIKCKGLMKLWKFLRVVMRCAI